jgi:hypothetical protein
MLLPPVGANATATTFLAIALAPSVFAFRSFPSSPGLAGLVGLGRAGRAGRVPNSLQKSQLIGCNTRVRGEHSSVLGRVPLLTGARFYSGPVCHLSRETE